MSADVLRRAAESIRERFEGEDVDDIEAAEFHLAVADWLDLMADDYAPYWAEPYAAPFVPVIEKAYRIARAYLGESA